MSKGECHERKRNDHDYSEKNQSGKGLSIYLSMQKETSKLQIVQDLQMGLSTVSQNLNALEQDGLISRDGYFESTGGRKAQVIQIVDRFPYFDRNRDSEKHVSYC